MQLENNFENSFLMNAELDVQCSRGGFRDGSVLAQIRTCVLPPVMDNGVAIKSSRGATRLIFADVTKESFSVHLESANFSARTSVSMYMSGPPSRSEERRVGKECRLRWLPDIKKK